MPDSHTQWLRDPLSFPPWSIRCALHTVVHGCGGNCWFPSSTRHRHVTPTVSPCVPHITLPARAVRCCEVLRTPPPWTREGFVARVFSRENRAPSCLGSVLWRQSPHRVAARWDGARSTACASELRRNHFAAIPPCRSSRPVRDSSARDPVSLRGCLPSLPSREASPSSFDQHGPCCLCRERSMRFLPRFLSSGLLQTRAAVVRCPPE